MTIGFLNHRENRYVIVGVSRSCGNRLPRTRLLNTTEIRPITVLGTRSPEPKRQQGHTPCNRRFFRGGASLASSSLWWPQCLCHISTSHKDTYSISGMDKPGYSLHFHLITSTKILFPNRVTFPNLRDYDLVSQVDVIQLLQWVTSKLN